MTRTTLAILLTAATLSLATLPVVAITPACPAAQAELLRVWEESNGVSSRKLAEAARAVVDECSTNEPASSESGADVQTRAATAGDKTIASGCGITDLKTGGVPDAPIKGVVQILHKTIVEYDHGPASVGYYPDNDLMTYNTVGAENWTFTAANNLAGTITWHGVPFQTTKLTGLAKAQTGCGVPPTPTLCWGYGEVQVLIPATGSIYAVGQFYNC